VQNAREFALAGDGHFAHGQMKRERRAIAPTAGYFATDADDVSRSCLEVTGDVAVVFFTIGRRHQHVDVTADDVGRAVPEQALRPAVEGFNTSVAVDDDDAIDR